MPGLKSEKRAEIKRMLAQGLHPAEIAAALGIPRSTVTYYAGPVRESEPVPDTPVIPGAAPVPDVHVIPSPDALTAQTLATLIDGLDAASHADRIRAAESILRNLGAAQKQSDWSPDPSLWKGFLRAACEAQGWAISLSPDPQDAPSPEQSV